MNLKSNKAITLVALIITIIILLILAGVSLSMVLGDNGLINKAQSSVDKYQQSANNEQAMLNSIEDYFKEYMPGEEMPLPDGWDGNIVTAISDGKHNIIPVPKEFYYVGGNLGNGVIISDNPADKYDGTVDKTTWEYTTSLVGNQFVWIPCTEAEYHKKNEWSGKIFFEGYDRTNATPEEVEKVQKYGGFYVARYEAGLADTIQEYTDTRPIMQYNVTGIPKSQAGQVPWHCINYTNSKSNAESMYTIIDSVESALITGTQWDIMLNKIVGTTNENGIRLTEEDIIDSNRWGNYKSNSIQYIGRKAYINYDSAGNLSISPFYSKSTGETTIGLPFNVLATGASKATGAYHIYDIAGNLHEWTDENVKETNQYFIRGGAMDCNSGSGACGGGGCDINTVSWSLGFRVMLYVK